MNIYFLGKVVICLTTELILCLHALKKIVVMSQFHGFAHILCLEHENFHIIRYNVQFRLGNHLANGTTIAQSLAWSVLRGSTVLITYMYSDIVIGNSPLNIRM